MDQKHTRYKTLRNKYPSPSIINKILTLTYDVLKNNESFLKVSQQTSEKFNTGAPLDKKKDKNLKKCLGCQITLISKHFAPWRKGRPAERKKRKYQSINTGFSPESYFCGSLAFGYSYFRHLRPAATLPQIFAPLLGDRLL